jgi:2'-5' RNA ligase
MHRLFVALRPPPPIRRALAALQDEVAGARWQDDEQLHLTLRFVGEVERRQAEDLAAALGEVRAAAPAVRLHGVGRFDSGHGGALWAGIAPREPLAALHRKVDRICVGIGLAPERRAYLPHVTLARLGRTAAAGIDAERWVARHAGLASEAFVPAHLVLYESRLGREGAAYEPVVRWPLA